MNPAPHLGSALYGIMSGQAGRDGPLVPAAIGPMAQSMVPVALPDIGVQPDLGIQGS